MNEATFWMVWNPQGRSPVVRHYEQGDAFLEAQRLARINPGQEFIVLQAVSKYIKADVQCVRFEPELPF